MIALAGDQMVHENRFAIKRNVEIVRATLEMMLRFNCGLV